jgi:hypothetical protein
VCQGEPVVLKVDGEKAINGGVKVDLGGGVQCVVTAVHARKVKRKRSCNFIQWILGCRSKTETDWRDSNGAEPIDPPISIPNSDAKTLDPALREVGACLGITLKPAVGGESNTIQVPSDWLSGDDGWTFVPHVTGTLQLSAIEPGECGTPGALSSKERANLTEATRARLMQTTCAPERVKSHYGDQVRIQEIQSTRLEGLAPNFEFNQDAFDAVVINADHGGPLLPRFQHKSP